MTESVVVGLSGGVDSAVAAMRLRDEGYRVIGVFMHNWDDDPSGYCQSAQDYASARAVADELGIDLQRVDFSAEYRERVFADFLAAYRAGRTPNPDILCNREIKFAPFVDHARRLGARWVATGHYARVDHDAAEPRLRRARDENKDQTYFLCATPRAAFADVLFPLGGLDKPQVRALARDAGLPNHSRPDSTGICFIGERRFRAFLSDYIAQAPGPIADEHDQVIGEHQGLHLFTLGQRRGLAIGGVAGGRDAPWYVIGKRAKDRTLIVSQDAHHGALYSRRLRAGPVNWIRQPEPCEAERLVARIRHRQPLQSCQIQRQEDGIEVTFEVAQRAATAGQFIALYSGDECLGGAEIVSVAQLAPADPMQAAGSAQ